MNINGLTKFIETKKLFSRDDQILLAVSGGIDSMVMSHMFQQAGYRFAIVHCNFGLRGKESDGDAEFVSKLAKQMKVLYFSEKFDTATIAARHGISVQMAARDLRYQWFEQIRKENNFTFIATAHHLDDQAETFLLNLIRGTGIAGLHGIPLKNGAVIRPMMFAFRKDIEQYATENQVKFRSDLSNHETKYLRNKLRHEIIPLLCSINPKFSKGLADSIRRISEFEEIGNLALDHWREDLLISNNTDKVIDIQHLINIEPAELYAWALFSPFGFNETQVVNILSCISKDSSKVFSSSTHRLVKERDKIVISSIKPPLMAKPVKIGHFVHKKNLHRPIPICFQRIREIGSYEIPATGEIASLDFDKLQFPLILRKWQKGDTFFPLGMRKRKKLSDFFIDQKFSLNDKEKAWLLCSGKDIVWIVGHRIDHRYRVTASTKEILCALTIDK
jgi:tRNA(Ile)-lysidine synthase